MGHKGSVLFFASCRDCSWQVCVRLVGQDDLQLPVVGRDSKALCFSLSLNFFRAILLLSERMLQAVALIKSSCVGQMSQAQWNARNAEARRESEGEGVSGEGCADTKLKSVQRSLCCGRLFPPQSKKTNKLCILLITTLFLGICLLYTRCNIISHNVPLTDFILAFYVTNTFFFL